tara:strand:- start:389 stop:784 length:396 start_codon:yes stop_codon:yes gene_type:complete
MIKRLTRKKVQNLIFNLIKSLRLISIIFFLGSTFLTFSNQSLALNNSQGEQIFIQHCSGCHIKGGNIIRRNKTLKMSSLKRNGIDSPEEIAKIARFGTGSMNGYEKVLNEEVAQVVANWIWEQSQNAWTQG